MPLLSILSHFGLFINYTEANFPFPSVLGTIVFGLYMARQTLGLRKPHALALHTSCYLPSVGSN